jgi:aryl-alcohol dehydrogenase-like predicted oxidoreductase
MAAIEHPKYRMGKSDLVVGQLGLGLMGMSEFYGATDEKESLEVIEEALKAGITHFDTADIYGNGKNEILLGKAMKGRREKFVVATKFGNVRDESGKWLGLSGKPEYVKKACDASLKRLDTNYIDLYYLHRLDPDTPIEVTVKAMGELVKEGKVKYIGLSEVSAENLRKAHAVFPITALQSEYSLWTLDIEDKIIPTCRELGIAIVPYSPLGRGFLTGQIKSPNDFAPDDFRRTNPRFQGENFKKNLELVEKVNQIAAEKKCSPAELALAWVLDKGTDVFPIPGTKRVKYLKENLGALKLKLTAADRKRIEEIIQSFNVSGTRYPAQMMSRVPQ